ncbi:hypothetical protein IGI04_035377, partial [Brassica rapa subsp. trilocularis]
RGLRVEWIFITSVSLSSLSSVDSQNVFLRCRCCIIRRTDCFCRRSKVADEVAEKEANKKALRKYLELVEFFTKVLVALYEQNDKPSSALEFIQQKLGGPSVSDYKKLQSEKSDLQIKDNEVFAKHQGTLRENFYMIGWNGNGVYRVLKIDQLDASELNLSEDFTAYTKKECYELLKRIHKENKATGGLKFVTLCYGIIGFIKFLGPYYMLSEIISLRNSSVICNISNSRDENSGGALYKKMFAWNEFLTRGIRNHLRNTVMIHPGKGLPSEILRLKLSRKLLEQMNGSVSFVREDERCFFQVDLQVKTRLGVETRGTEADSSIQ